MLSTATFAHGQVVTEYADGKQMQHFYPYAENGGTVVAIAGEDFAVIASDTRLSTGYQIYTREQPKINKLTSNSVLGCTGCWCDVLTLNRIVQARLQMYEHEHNKPMSTDAIAQMISTMLYYKRFFPYYVSNVLAGIDRDGKGCVFSYDPVGHMEKETYTAGGSSGAVIQPLLDNQIGFKNMEKVPQIPLTIDRTVALVKDVFISAAERDIYTGDGVVINVITKQGVKEEFFPLRKD